jgi:hypothetical protein
MITIAAESVAQKDYEIAQLRTTINALEQEAELIVCFDADLKNDGQRKARKGQILEAGDHPDFIRQLMKLNHDRAIAAIVLEQKRNEFSALKLEARLKIAEAAEF